MEQQVFELTKKVENLTGQIAYLTEQAQIAERQRQNRDELVRDITPIANQAFNLTIEQLEEIQDYIDLSDILRLVKRLMRNGRHLDRMLDQLESFMDLMETLGPLSDEAFKKMVDTLTDLEHKGYFNLAKSSTRILDNVVSSINEDELRSIEDSITPSIKIIMELMRPQNLEFFNHTLKAGIREFEKPVDNSFSGLVRQLRDPAVRRGIALLLRGVKVIGNQVEA